MRNPTGIPWTGRPGSILDEHRADCSVLHGTRGWQSVLVYLSFLMEKTCVLLCEYAYTKRHLLVEYLEKELKKE